MNKCSPGRGHGPRRPWPRRARVAAVITVMAAAALLAAACSGSPSSTGSGGSPNAGGSANSRSALAYSQCVRAHGIPNFPDPDSNGQIPKQAILQLGVSDSRLRAATGACAQLNPYNSSGSQPTASAQTIAGRLSFSRCMRGHGVPNFPDPNSTGNYDLHGIDPRSPVVRSAALTCLHVLSPHDQQRVRTAVGG
jgi:hypothetical protein